MRLSDLLAPLLDAKVDHELIRQVVLAYEDDRQALVAAFVPAGARLSSRQWALVRARILSRDGGVCAYCGETAGTVDHVVPIALGGSNTDDNLVACCAFCNGSKGAKPLSEWRALQ